MDMIGLGNVFSEGSWSGELSLKCLSCGNDYVAVNNVEINELGDVLKITRGPNIEYKRKLVSGRGTKVCIGYICENCGNSSELQFQFHKGTTMVNAEAVANDGLPSFRRD